MEKGALEWEEMISFDDKEKQIPEEFKSIAKEFAGKGFITTSTDNL